MSMKNTHERTPRLLLAVSMAMTATLVMAFQPAYAQRGSNALEAIDVAALPGNQVQLRLRMSEPAPEPQTFSTDNPPRIAIDLPDTYWAAESRRTDVSIGPVRSVMGAESQGRVRLVVNLSDMVDYATRVEGNTILVTLGGGLVATPMAPVAAAKSQEPTPPPGKEGSVPREPAIESIDFRRGPNGEGRVVVDLTSPRTAVDLKQEGDQIVLELKNVQVPDALVQRYDVTDFATPVTTVDTLRRGRDARVIVSTAGEYEQLAYQMDDQFILEIKPVEEEEVAEANREKEYTGERLTLNFQDLEVRAFFSIIADLTGMNVVVSDSVTGNITLRLQNVPWDQAVDIVLRTKGLAMRQNGNVMLVAPAQELAAMERMELESRAQIQELEPLRSEFIQVNYAKAADLAALIEGSEDASILSERGSVTLDERTNTLLVRDTAERLANIRQLVQTLDIPVQQVLIESRIVIANEDFNKELGIRLGYTNYNLTPDADEWALTSGSTSQNLGLVEDISQGNALEFLDPNRYNVNMPVTSPAGSIAFAVLGNSYLVDLELSALQAEGRGEVVSSPRIVTANQHEAMIQQGVELPYQEASASGATTTQFKDAVLELRVTPQITPDDRIILDLAVKKDNLGENVATPTGFIPTIDTRELTTQVLVNNGDTVVLGGVYETTRTQSVQKVPLLGDIPVIGALFRSKQQVADKRELLVFITPKILDEDLNID
ncbi:MAG TPA: type IV pilus secretin PilQ [Gammaproteobacteria bacterium]